MKTNLLWVGMWKTAFEWLIFLDERMERTWGVSGYPQKAAVRGSTKNSFENVTSLVSTYSLEAILISGYELGREREGMRIGKGLGRIGKDWEGLERIGKVEE